MKLFGLEVEARRLRGAEKAEHDRLLGLGEQLLREVPDLRAGGRTRFAELGTLADQGWTGEQVLRLVKAWPSASAIVVSMVVSLAARITRDGLNDPDEVIDWTCAILETDGDRVIPKGLVRTEVKAAGRRVPEAVALWSEAAGSHQGGLAALKANVTLDEARRRRPQ